jgi:hypothetical protein
MPSPGDFVNVLITDSHEYDLVGEIVSGSEIGYAASAG